MIWVFNAYLIKQVCNNKNMNQIKILQELEKNEKDQKIRDKVFGAPIDSERIKKGLPVKEIIKEMRKASRENLFRVSTNATFCQ